MGKNAARGSKAPSFSTISRHIVLWRDFFCNSTKTKRAGWTMRSWQDWKWKKNIFVMSDIFSPYELSHNGLKQYLKKPSNFHPPVFSRNIALNLSVTAQIWNQIFSKISGKYRAIKIRNTYSESILIQRTFSEVTQMN